MVIRESPNFPKFNSGGWPVETWRPASISDELIGSEGVIASLIKDAFHELLTTII